MKAEIVKHKYAMCFTMRTEGSLTKESDTWFSFSSQLIMQSFLSKGKCALRNKRKGKSRWLYFLTRSVYQGTTRWGYDMTNDTQCDQMMDHSLVTSRVPYCWLWINLAPWESNSSNLELGDLAWLKVSLRVLRENSAERLQRLVVGHYLFMMFFHHRFPW